MGICFPPPVYISLPYLIWSCYGIFGGNFSKSCTFPVKNPITWPYKVRWANERTGFSYMVHGHRSFCRVSVLSHVVRQWQAGSQTQAILMLLYRYICESSGPGHHAGCQEVSRCHTRGESEEFIACR